MKKLFVFLFFALFGFLPNFVFAQALPKDEVFDAKILNILEEKKIIREDGSESMQQNIRLQGLGGSWKDREFTYFGISDIDVLGMSNTRFKPGDKVMVNYGKNIDGNDNFYIINFIRRGYLYLLGFIFAAVIVLVGKKKGIKSLISLVITFFVIIKFIIPKIISGYSPLLVAFFGSVVILGLIIYITEGVNKKTHVALISIAASVVITFIFSYIFVKLTRLTGFASEETSFLVGMTGNPIDFKGLLLAGILIGALGVLDDVVLGQIEAVSQIYKANPNLSKKELFKAAGEIGQTHLSSMVNTLFLTYAGASLPLLVLFSLSPSAMVTLGTAIDNEFVATEIVRTLAGSIGLTLSFPITTFLAIYFLTEKNANHITHRD